MSQTGEMMLWWAILIVAVLGSAMTSAIETASYALNHVRLTLRLGRTPPEEAAVRLREELGRPDRILSTVIVVNNVCTYLVALAVAGVLRQDEGDSPLLSLLTDIFVITPVLLLFGEALPKELARVEADRLAYVLVYPLWFMRKALTYCGVLPAITLINRWARSLLGDQEAPEGISDSRQRMSALLREGAVAGVLSESQSSLMERALTLGGSRVEDQMLPWSQVRVAHEGWDRARLTQTLSAWKHSQVPVLDRKGKVVGVLRRIDLFLHPQAKPAELIKECVRLSPRAGIREALRTLAEHGQRVAIVEQGGRPVGFLTTNDLFEPLIGELPGW